MILKILQSSLMRLLMKFCPLSVRIDDEALYLQIISSYSIRATSLTSVDFNGKACGHLEKACTTKRIYLCPSLSLVKYPRKSI